MVLIAMIFVMGQAVNRVPSKVRVGVDVVILTLWNRRLAIVVLPESMARALCDYGSMSMFA